MSSLRENLKSVLRTLGLLPLCRRVRDHFRRSARIRLARREGLADAFPTPAGELIDLTIATEDPYEYYAGGKRAFDNICDTLASAGVDRNGLREILDFGCGCGRVLRRWHPLTGKLHGTDYNPRLTAFDKNAFPFARIATNGLYPPLEYADSQFGFVYQFSVFTHLTLDCQKQWMAEFHRILRPGGMLFFTTQGEHFLNHRPFITEEMKERFRRDGFFMLEENREGENACGAFHSREFVERELLEDRWELLRFSSGGGTGVPGQDIYLVRSRKAIS